MLEAKKTTRTKPLFSFPFSFVFPDALMVGNKYYYDYRLHLHEEDEDMLEGDLVHSHVTQYQ